MGKSKTKKGRRAAKLEQYSKDLNFDELLAVRLSPKSIEILRKIAKLGIFGRTPEEVAERLIDDNLQRFVKIEDLTLKL